jgi:hypothetical protein
MAELSLPAAVDFSKKLPHLPENTATSLMTVLPTNGNAFKAGSVISFDLPAQPGLYLDGKTAFLRYKFKYSSGATAPILRATPALTPFFKLDEFINSVPVNSVYNYNQVANMYVQTHLGVSEKYGVQAALFSELKNVAGNDTLGDSVTLIASQSTLAGYCSFAFPLYCSALSQMDKYLPTGLAGSYRIQLTLAQIADMVSVTANLTDYQIESVELCINAMQLGVGVDQMIASMGETIMIKSTGWANAGVGQIASGASGVVSMLANHRFQSINNLYVLGSGAAVASDLNGIFDSRDVTSCAGTYQVTIGSQTFPQLPINTAVNKNAVLQYLRECTSSLADWRYAMSINAVEFASYLGSANATQLTGNITPSAATTVTEPAKFIVGIPVSKIQPIDSYAPSSLLSGVSAASTPIIVNISVGTATGQAYNMFCIAEYDVLLHIDPMSRTTSVIQ